MPEFRSDPPFDPRRLPPHIDFGRPLFVICRSEAIPQQRLFFDWDALAPIRAIALHTAQAD